MNRWQSVLDSLNNAECRGPRNVGGGVDNEVARYVAD